MTLSRIRREHGYHLSRQLWPDAETQCGLDGSALDCDGSSRHLHLDCNMRTILCTEARHGRAILEIFNDAIVNSTAVYDYQPRPPEWISSWFAAKRAADYPVVGVEDPSGTLLGFGSYGAFRAWPAYRYTVEHSIYVGKDHRGRGIGRVLLNELIEQARAHDRHVMVGGIDAGNAASIALHLSSGFEHAGTIRHAGFKFGRWLDLAFYQRILDTPARPSEQ